MAGPATARCVGHSEVVGRGTHFFLLQVLFAQARVLGALARPKWPKSAFLTQNPSGWRPKLANEAPNAEFPRNHCRRIYRKANLEAGQKLSGKVPSMAAPIPIIGEPRVGSTAKQVLIRILSKAGLSAHQPARTDGVSFIWPAPPPEQASPPPCIRFTAMSGDCLAVARVGQRED